MRVTAPLPSGARTGIHPAACPSFPGHARRYERNTDWLCQSLHRERPFADALKRRGRGRSGRGAEPAQVVALRLTTDELAALDARAAREHKSRSELIREAIAAYAA